MKIIYLGAEVPSNRTLLESTTANHVGVSFWRLVRRGLPKTKPYLIENYFSQDTYVYVNATIPKTEKLSGLDLEDYSALYEEFIANNMDRLTTFNEIVHPDLDPSFIDEQRRTAWSEVPPSKFLPVWQEQTGKGGLAYLCDRYLDVAIPGEMIEKDVQLSSVTRRYVSKHGTRFHALSTAKPENLRQIQAESASTLAWLSPMLNGETIVWDGTRLVRYNKKMKDQGRSRYSHVYEKAGLSFDLIMEDDPQEVCRLAVWSYEQFEMRMNVSGNKEFDDSLLDNNSEGSDVEESGEIVPTTPNNSGNPMRKLLAREEAEMGALPVFGSTLKTIVERDGDGNDVLKDVTLITSNDSTLRVCDTCFVASSCPAFKPQSACAFKLPVSIKTKEQQEALDIAMMEMQVQRIAFMRFAEEQSGGYADPNLSKEMDRLVKMREAYDAKYISKESISLKIERSGSSGVLSSIFGDRVQALKELPNNGFDEEQTTRIIQQNIEGS